MALLLVTQPVQAADTFEFEFTPTNVGGNFHRLFSDASTVGGIWPVDILPTTSSELDDDGGCARE